ncbi:MAG: hypothetical protein GWO20_09475, partial [Candidatus Korarchaeota archaeon]|nr:hypothetical protein [Candidatus Korarchaeota archaeon]NIW14354.1 hypothetical protein [Candidatus Thorarchaeota archaeon]NIW52440.1 hypothetical protein [Candidatus Korarchaeota archaeon]
FRPNFADIHVTNLKVIVGFHSTPSKLALLEGDALAQYPLSSHAKHSTTLTTLDGPQPKYVIIRPTGWGTAINAFKSWKESYNGFTVQERSPTWITSHYPGDDKAERVKNFINDSYITNGTKYFLLVGDSDKVPVQQVWAGQQPYAYGYLDDNGSLPSDYYYECLGKWDTNDDQIYGAPNDTGMDIYPEVRIGRIPVKTATQAKNSLARIVSREKNPVLGN